MAADPIIDPTPAKGEKGRWFTIFLGLICIGLAVEVLLLVRKNQQLTEELTRIVSERTLQTVQPGDLIVP